MSDVDETGMDKVGEYSRVHGPPVRVRTGVLSDADGHQVTIEWWFEDGAIYRQVFNPMPEREALDASRSIAKTIRTAFGVEPEVAGR